MLMASPPKLRLCEAVTFPFNALKRQSPDERFHKIFLTLASVFLIRIVKNFAMQQLVTFRAEEMPSLSVAGWHPKFMTWCIRFDLLLEHSQSTKDIRSKMIT
ncbi:hypothetical protein Tco_1320259 [Tanacetum coccineum]